MPTRTPTRVEALEKWRESILRDCRVAMPAVITKFEPSTQLAEVQPLISDQWQDEDDSYTNIRPPPIPNVPVQFCGAGGYRGTFPVAVGDTVLLVIADRSLDAWMKLGGFQDPVDTRRHDLSDAVALLGVHDNKHPWTGVRTDAATWGKDGGPQVAVTASQIQLGGTDETVACAGKVAAELSALWAALNAHAHEGVQSGSDATATADSTGSLGSAGSVASSMVKVKS